MYLSVLKSLGLFACQQAAFNSPQSLEAHYLQGTINFFARKCKDDVIVRLRVSFFLAPLSARQRSNKLPTIVFSFSGNRKWLSELILGPFLDASRREFFPAQRISPRYTSPRCTSPRYISPRYVSPRYIVWNRWCFLSITPWNIVSEGMFVSCW